MAAVTRRDDPWVVAGSTGLLAEQRDDRGSRDR
jgi:hypothetical protein